MDLGVVLIGPLVVASLSVCQRYQLTAGLCIAMIGAVVVVLIAFSISARYKLLCARSTTKRVCIIILACLLQPPAFCKSEETFAALEYRVPFLKERLHSKRWQIRYGLLSQLGGRDGETKRALELLVKDENTAVANQALVRYLHRFVNVDKTLFNIHVYAKGAYPLGVLPKENLRRTIVDYCLGRTEIASKYGEIDMDHGGVIPVLDVLKRDEPRMYQSLTIVGILGDIDDARALYPFLESANDYVAWGAAKALIRLGDKSKSIDAVRRLAEKDVSQNLYYVTEALYLLREIDDTEFQETVLRILSRVQQEDDIPPNWLTKFLLLASDVKKDVWE